MNHIPLESHHYTLTGIDHQGRASYDLAEAFKPCIKPEDYTITITPHGVWLTCRWQRDTRAMIVVLLKWNTMFVCSYNHYPQTKAFLARNPQITYIETMFEKPFFAIHLSNEEDAVLLNMGATGEIRHSHFAKELEEGD